MPDGAMAQALRAAGVVPASERLAAIAREIVRARPETASDQHWTDAAAQARLKEVALAAVRQNPRNWDGARDTLFKAVRGDAALLWEMFAPFRNQAAQMVLTAAASEMRREELARQGQRGGAGQSLSEDQTPAARPSTSRAAPATGQGDAGQLRPDNQTTRAGIAAVAAAARRSLLDTFRINGQPIGDVTPREAEKWAASRERDARFVKRLIENLPADVPIRRFRTGEEAARLYAEAQEARNA